MAPCEEIRECTNLANIAAVISDGSRVLGLGNIGPLASLPVMEGKPLLFKYLGGVAAFPIVVGKRFDEAAIARLGAGAAGAATLRALLKAGVPACNARVVDPVDGRPVLLTDDLDLDRLFPHRGATLAETNSNQARAVLPRLSAPTL